MSIIHNFKSFYSFYRPRQTVLISSEEYVRFLKYEVQLMKYKEICTSKATELKRLHDQLAYYKKQNQILRNAKDDAENSENKKPTLENVMNHLA